MGVNTLCRIDGRIGGDDDRGRIWGCGWTRSFRAKCSEADAGALEQGCSSQQLQKDGEGRAIINTEILGVVTR